MYTIVLILFLFIAGFLIYNGFATKNRFVQVLGIALGIFTVVFFWYMSFWGEMLWFRQLGFNERFWIVWLAKTGLFLGAALLSGLFVWLLTYSLKKEKRYIRYVAVLLGAIIGATWWPARWDIVLKFLYRVPTDVTEPVLHMTTGFYLFNYPFLKALYDILLYLSLVSVGASLIDIFMLYGNEQKQIDVKKNISPSHSLFTGVGVVLLVLAYGKYLRRFDLLFSQQGVVFGPGWTDTNIRLPLLLAMSVLTGILGIIMIIPKFRQWIQRSLFRVKDNTAYSSLYIIPGSLFILWLVVLSIIPSLYQWLKVEPNEITVERPYIENNIKFTNLGFHLDKVEENEFPVSSEFSYKDIEENKDLFSNIRLWDYRALDAVFKQFQEIRLYYEFADVDIDRYDINSQYREVMISAREMKPENLPPSSQTFINKHFKYTHGYGIALTKVNEFTPEGLPNLLIKDIPPVSKYPELNVTRPEIYYGELTKDYVVVNSKEEEFDYPSGENNVYARYQGKGGVPISNLWRKVLYGWKFGGTKFLLSGYPTKESRIMMHRNIIDRIRTLAPFLSYDDDPYIVLENGQLYWIIDAYTTSRYFPYSEPFAAADNYGQYMRGKNYIRNSVKVTVNAYSGEVNFYIFEESDPLIQVYNKMFPGLLKDKSEMPDELRKHIRYPADMLLVQGLIYTKYHMTDPTVFYNQEDLWVRATEKYYDNVQPVEPYYIMWKKPGEDDVEFVLILPFTPKNKQVMIGWIAGMCDGENYGRFLAYKFPKEKRVLGTQQVETKIDQDSYLSGQLTLWDQRGSNVIRGNVLAIPIEKTILYVEPIYLKSQTAAYPELRLVAVMHDDRLSYAETFDKALYKLFKSESMKQEEVKKVKTEGVKEDIHELINTANDAFENYLNYMQQKKFTEAGKSLEELQDALKELSDQNNKEEN